MATTYDGQILTFGAAADTFTVGQQIVAPAVISFVNPTAGVVACALGDGTRVFGAVSVPANSTETIDLSEATVQFSLGSTVTFTGTGCNCKVYVK